MPRYRALPWAHRQELAQLYAWIWDDPDDRESTERACARLSIYLQSPSQPLFIPILHSLLTALLLPYPPQTPHEHLTSRLTHGAALTRFINALVDPLQQRTYARPIALIARELGLPEGLVALRHAVTHEDLPALEVLRSGSLRAVDWLRRDVVGPAVWPGDVVQEDTTAWAGEADFCGALGRYKKLIKAYYRQRTSARGVSSSAGWEGARALRMVMRQMEDLVGSALEGKDAGREKVARRIARVLLARQGGMVPSFRKRPGYDPERPDDFPAPTSATLRIWTPLLTLLGEKFSALNEDEDGADGIAWPEYFASECAAVIRETLDAREAIGTELMTGHGGQESHEADYWVVPSEDEAEPVVKKRDVQAEETTFIASLSGWLIYALSETSGATRSTKKRKRRGEEEEVDGVLMLEEGARGRVVRDLVEQAGMRAVRDAVRCYEGAGDVSSGPGMSHVLSAIMRVDETCRQIIYQLAASTPDVSEVVLGSDAERIMEQRLEVFRKTMTARAQVDDTGEGEGVEVKGWVKLGPASGWKECPIGYWRG